MEVKQAPARLRMEEILYTQSSQTYCIEQYTLHWSSFMCSQAALARVREGGGHPPWLAQGTLPHSPRSIEASEEKRSYW